MTFERDMHLLGRKLCSSHCSLAAVIMVKSNYTGCFSRLLINDKPLSHLALLPYQDRLSVSFISFNFPRGSACFNRAQWKKQKQIIKPNCRSITHDRCKNVFPVVRWWTRGDCCQNGLGLQINIVVNTIKEQCCLCWILHTWHSQMLTCED